MKINTVTNRPLSLVAHLERLAELLKNGSVEYDWSEPERCNCGLLARVIGVDSSEISRLSHKVHGTYGDSYWTTMVQATCPLTGIPQHQIFTRLFAAGLQYEDFAHLEYLSNEEIVNDMELAGYKIKGSRNLIQFVLRLEPKDKTREWYYDEANDVAVYLTHWANMIRKYHTQSEVIEGVSSAELVEINAVLSKVK